MNYQGNTNCLNIPSIDAKDLYIANHQKDNDIGEVANGYSLRYKSNGKIQENIQKYINTYDFSLDLIELRDYVQKNGKNFNIRKKDFSFYNPKNKKKEYSKMIINVTFKYSVKRFNRVRKNVYVKHGYENHNLEFNDCVATETVFDDDGNAITEVIGVKTNQTIDTDCQCNILPSCFVKKFKKNSPKQLCYKIKESSNTTIKNVSDLRKDLYMNGFVCDGRSYVRFKRSSGSSRVGKCLFIEKNLYNHMHRWEMCGLNVKIGDEVDLAALEAYIALPTSSIVDTIDIDPKSILIIDDYESVFNDTVIETTIGDDGWLHTDEKTIEIHNSIWDGQSLIDKSVMGEYSCYGMLLLRNKFFKSCCFNTNIQKWFEHNNITDIAQLNGFTLATDVSEIKMITTPNSVKYLKFGSMEQWLNNLPSMFGVVKHEKKTHFFDGDMVQTHYQLLNTLQLSREETNKLLQLSFDYMNKLNTDVNVLKRHIKCNQPITDENEYTFNSINDAIYTLLNISEDFSKTTTFDQFRHDLLRSYRKNLKKGHVLINGNYSVLFGNPLEMLRATIDNFDPSNSSLKIGEVYNTRFANNQELLCCRSPHVTIGNILIAKNTYVDNIDTYFNLTDEIICLNSINDNILERLSGCDFDSDQMLVTDNKILLNAAKKNYEVFKVPTSNVHARKVQRKYTSDDQADLDIRTSNNLIGEIINLSQQLNSQLWHMANNTKMSIKELYESDEDFRKLYFDICQLDVMSCIEIDKAKKEFDVDSKAEIKRIQNRHIELDEDTGLRKQSSFLGTISQIKGYEKKQNVSYIKYDTTMDYLLDQITKYTVAYVSNDLLPISKIFIPTDFDWKKVNQKQISKIVKMFEDLYTLHYKIMHLDSLYYSYEEKLRRYTNEKNKVFKELTLLKINSSTAYRLLRYIDNDKIKTKFYLLEYLSFYMIHYNFGKMQKNYILQRTDSIDNPCYYMTLYNIPYAIEQVSV